MTQRFSKHTARQIMGICVTHSIDFTVKFHDPLEKINVGITIEEESGWGRIRHDLVKIQKHEGVRP
jgi:hypothetical protein